MSIIMLYSIGLAAIVTAPDSSGLSRQPSVSGTTIQCMSERNEKVPPRQGQVANAPARDGNIAIQEEYDMALETNTVEALELFINRHPEHPLAEKALEHLKTIKQEN
ncbi:MAG: hypothetical protein KAT26_13230 [Marinosulfonomonas sp.]|nr:hypothetical protein [Marinosulfonomonas sp.]